MVVVNLLGRSDTPFYLSRQVYIYFQRNMFIQPNQTYCHLSFSEQDKYFMHYALQLADQAEKLGEIPVGAVIVNQHGEIIGEGFNFTISSNDPTAHAEIQAIRMAAEKVQNYRLTDCTLYVTLEPCPMCAGAILHSRLTRLVFGAMDYKTGAIGSRYHLFEDYKMNHFIDIRGGILMDECRYKISNFFSQRRAEKKRLKAEQATEKCI